MKKLKVVVAVAAATLMSAAFGQSIPGESLDSGLGELSATYAAAEFNRPGWVRGESMDSGLGRLSPTYTAAEYNTPGWVRGESMDSGLGELPSTYTAAEFLPDVMMAAQGATER